MANEFSEKRVGVEVEFFGLSARQAAAALRAELGGEIAEEDRHAFHLSGSAIGDVAVELDIRHAHPQRHGAALSLKLPPSLAGLFGHAASPLVPREMIVSPRPPHALIDVDRAIVALRRAGATGDGRRWRQTLGLHFNISADDLTPSALRATALATVRLDARIRSRICASDPPLAAALPPAYPAAYAALLETGGTLQDIASFIDAYLAFNPTRDRALDLLPLLLHLDGPRVRERLPYEKISARPVYHWRLPVARVGLNGWSMRDDWSDWLSVEALAGEILRASGG